MKWLDSPGALGSRRSKMAYLEDENGEAVSSRTIKAIRRVLCGGWSELVNRKIAPQSWGKLSASGRQLIHSFMENEFPLFKFAKNGWKLDHLATSTYPAWRRSNLDGNCGWKSGVNAVKLEEEEDDGDGDDAESDGDGSGPTKRNKRKYLPVTEIVKSEVVKKKRKGSSLFWCKYHVNLVILVVPTTITPPESTSIPASSPSLLNQPVDLPMIQACPSPSPIPSPHESPIVPASSSSSLSQLLESSSAPLLESFATQVSSSVLPNQLQVLDSDLGPPAIHPSPLPASDVSSACKENIPLPTQSIPSPKPVKITITNPL